MTLDRDWLEEALGRLAAATEYPATPDIASRLDLERRGTRIPLIPGERRTEGPLSLSPRERPGVRGAFPTGLALRLATAAALVTVAAAISLAVSRGARDAVADFLGLGVAGERIEITQPTSGPTPTPLPRFDSLAEPVSLEEARAAMSFELLVPPKTDVQAVFLLEFLGLDGVVVRTAETVRYDLWQFRATPGLFLGKSGPVAVEETRVGGRTAYWVTGGPRLLTVVDASGRELTGVAVETDVNALVWERDGITYRIEGDLVLQQALAIAEAFE